MNIDLEAMDGYSDRQIIEIIAAEVDKDRRWRGEDEDLEAERASWLNQDYETADSSPLWGGSYRF